MVGFNQVRAGFGEPKGAAELANDIIESNKALRIATAVGEAVVEGDALLAHHCKIVGEYGAYLKRHLALIIRDPVVFDSNVLPHDRSKIELALKECATRLPLSKDEIASLGDLHFYLSHFIEGLEVREDPESELFLEQAEDGVELRSEWQKTLGGRKLSSFSQTLASWLKPNA
jgi:hypothetical protein